MPELRIYSWVSVFSESAFRQKTAKMFMSRSQIMRLISQRQHVVSMISLVNFRQSTMFTRILVISFNVSKSISFFYKHEIIIVFKQSMSKIYYRFSSSSDNRLKHLHDNWKKTFSFY